MSGAYHSARDIQGDLELSCDVVVVGSGAGGSVVATELAEAGWSVIVLEEGPRVTPEEHARMRPSESMRHAWRDGAFTVTIPRGDTPAINVTMGRVVGGSSVLTGGVCFRIPDAVMRQWTDELKLPGFTPREMEPYFEHVERAIHVEEVPRELRSRSTELFALGAEKRGLRIQPMQRNTRGCKGCGACNFGCPEKAKLSVDLSYLPRAIDRGAQVWSHVLVEKVETKHGRAVGVSGRSLNRTGGRPGGRVRVHARRVVVSAGAWHDPLILRRSGIGRYKRVGKGLTLHPGFRCLAEFDEPVRGWRGALQSAWSDSLEDEGITLTSLFVPVGVLGATMPGVGVEHSGNARNIDHLAMFGGIIHDGGGGTVHRGPGREPIVTYRMRREDKARIPSLLRNMAESFFEAGAKRVYLPILGLRGLDADGLRKLEIEKIPGRQIECASQHPLGGCQMGSDHRRSVVNAEGKVWDVDELYVVDGSILPTSLGVNPQLSIMSIATRAAWAMRDTPLP